VNGSTADLVLVGGKIRTPAHPAGFAAALAARGGVIQALGADTRGGAAWEFRVM